MTAITFNGQTVYDIGELVPRVQRAIEGVVQSQYTLTFDEAYNVTADACADVLLYTGSIFGGTLIVTGRDPITNAPVSYATPNQLDPSQNSVISSQAALTYFYQVFKNMKMSETIGDEASNWSYTKSPNLLIAQLKLLQDTRDRALEAVNNQNGGMEAYVSFLAVRDTFTSRFVESWVWGVPESFGLGAGAGLQSDSRFSPLPSGGGVYLTP